MVSIPNNLRKYIIDMTYKSIRYLIIIYGIVFAICIGKKQINREGEEKMKNQWQALNKHGLVLGVGNKMSDVDVMSPRPAFIVRYQPGRGLKWFDLRGSVYPLTTYRYSTDSAMLAETIRAAK